MIPEDSEQQDCRESGTGIGKGRRNEMKREDASESTCVFPAIRTDFASVLKTSYGETYSLIEVGARTEIRIRGVHPCGKDEALDVGRLR